MRELINKRGAAHFEMIFAFVFFVGFLFFLFAVLKPQDTSTLSSAVIVALYDSFEEEAHTNLSSVFLKTNYGGSSSCFVIDLPENMFVYALHDGNSYVSTLEGVSVDSDLSGGKLDVENESNFFRVLISPEFSDKNLALCETLNDEDYELGQIIERRVISYSSLENMANRYRSNYEGLRNTLKVPEIFDFAIVVEDMPEIVMSPRSGIPDSVEVQAQDYIIEVLNNKGEISNRKFTLQIW